MIASGVDHQHAFGVGASVTFLCDELCTAGHDVTLISGDHPRSRGIPSPRRNRHGSLSVRLFPIRYPWNRRLQRSPEMISWLRSAVHDFELIDIHGIWSLVAAEAGTVCARAGVPYVMTPHGMMAHWDWAKRPMKKRVFFAVTMRNVWRSAAAIRFLSIGEAKASLVDAGRRAVVIPNFVASRPAFDPGLEALRFRSKMGIPGDAAVMLFLGRVSPEKGVLEMLEAFNGLSRRCEAVLLVVGALDGAYGAAVKDRVARLPCGRNIRLAGPLFGNDKDAAFAASTIFITLSKSEGLPVAALEALAHGLPTLLAGESNLPEVRDYDSGVLTSRNPEEVGGAMLALLEDRERLRVMGANARRLFEQRFAAAVVVPRIISMYENVARCRPTFGFARPEMRLRLN